MEEYTPEVLDVVKSVIPFFPLKDLEIYYIVIDKKEYESLRLLSDCFSSFEYFGKSAVKTETLHLTKIENPEEIKETRGDTAMVLRRENFKTLATKIIGMKKTLEEWAPMVETHKT